MAADNMFGVSVGQLALDIIRESSWLTWFIAATVTLVACTMLLILNRLGMTRRFAQLVNSLRWRVQSSGAHRYMYYYWSDRAIESLRHDHAIRFNQFEVSKMASPTFGGTVPTIEFAKGGPIPQPSRYDMAAAIERALKSYVATDLGSGRGRYLMARGRGHIIYSSVEAGNWQQGDQPGSIVMFTKTIAPDGTRAGVCLFGSIDNFVDWLREAAPAKTYGWSSSATVPVMEWLRGEQEFDERLWGVSLAGTVSRIGNYQAVLDSRDSDYQPGRRLNRYLFETMDSEWLAIVHSEEPVPTDEPYLSRHFDKVVIGRPVWVRTLYPKVRDADGRRIRHLSDRCGNR